MKRLLLLSFAFLLATVSFAQTDNGLMLSAGVSHKFNKKFSLDGEVEMRTRNDFRTMDRWSVGIGAGYKFTKYLKASIDYTLLIDNNPEKIYSDDFGTVTVVNKWRPSYWGVRHRFNLSLTGSVDIGRFTLSLRERLQYTCRPESTQDLYDFGTETWEKKAIGAKNKAVLRSRFQVEYNIKKCKVNPFANVEFFNAWSLQKTRIIVGADWKVTKVHNLSFYYRLQLVNKNIYDDEPNNNMFGVGYNFKF